MHADPIHTDINDEKVLGHYWNNELDEISLKIHEIFKNAIDVRSTKRNILSVIASVYDPVGYLQPIVIKLKILFQEICKCNIDWDDEIGYTLLEKWKNIIQDFIYYDVISFKRCFYVYEINDPIEKYYLHGFSDASKSAYAAVIYIKSISKSGNSSVKFVTSKSRVIPLKKTFTIPRLELLGNVILSSLIRTVYNSFSEEIIINEIYCWSDSLITLSWIKCIKKEYNPFVQNRVIKIRNNVNHAFWNFCSTKENVADIITKFNSHDLLKNTMWWDGPLFIKTL